MAEPEDPTTERAREWRVRRRWLPWRRRIRDVPDTGIGNVTLGDDPISAVIGVFLLILALPVLIVLLALLLELVLLLALLPVFVLLRLALPVPWTIEVHARPAPRSRWSLLVAWATWTLQREERVAGWRASRERIAQLRRELGVTRDPSPFG